MPLISNSVIPEAEVEKVHHVDHFETISNQKYSDLAQNLSHSPPTQSLYELKEFIGRLHTLTPDISKLLLLFHATWKKATLEIKQSFNQVQKSEKNKLELLIKDRFNELFNQIQESKADRIINRKIQPKNQ